MRRARIKYYTEAEIEQSRAEAYDKITVFIPKLIILVVAFGFLPLICPRVTKTIYCNKKKLILEI